MDILFESFNSLAAFREAINARPLNRVFAPHEKNLSSQDYDGGDKGTVDYKEAEALLSCGWTEGLANIKKVAGGNLQPRGAAYSAKMTTDYIGFFPNLGAYLAGDPCNMYNRTKSKRVSPTVEIGIIFGVPWFVSTSDIITVSARLLSAIATIESQGVRCGITLIAGNVGTYQTAIATIRVKQPNQYFDALKLAYPLVHPSMQRRHKFRWLETLDGIRDKSFYDNYGHTIDTVPAGYLPKDTKVVSIYNIVNNGTTTKDIIKQICAL